jgi:hypothetical protein
MRGRRHPEPARWVQPVIWTLISHRAPGDAPKFVIDEGQEPVPRRLIPTAPCDEELRHVRWRGCCHRTDIQGSRDPGELYNPIKSAMRAGTRLVHATAVPSKRSSRGTRSRMFHRAIARARGHDARWIYHHRHRSRDSLPRHGLGDRSTADRDQLKPRCSSPV